MQAKPIQRHLFADFRIVISATSVTIAITHAIIDNNRFISRKTGIYFACHLISYEKKKIVCHRLAVGFL
jgi:hypothetical protein